ncbi:MAG TPA: AraC family transcriptional regulator [Puia sp.]|jgi:AraC-like DNA-binding protein|nr:AraC family transcriptional regulator [Puia sp.]
MSTLSSNSIRLTHYDFRCIERALAYIDQNYRNALSPEQLSIEATLNIKKLRAGIRKKTGHTLHEYHFKVRIEKSKVLLRDSDHPLKYIATMVGFKNESHFCQKFRKFVGMTPNEFRYLAVDE